MCRLNLRYDAGEEATPVLPRGRIFNDDFLMPLDGKYDVCEGVRRRASVPVALELARELNPAHRLCAGLHDTIDTSPVRVDRCATDRVNDRMQVFTKEGKFVKEIFVQKDSLADGSVWDVAFSKDPQQKYLYMADGRNQKLRIFDRQSLVELTNFGEGGHYPGQWYSLHSIAVDSKGNLYTTETYQGRRVQKFVNKGLAPVTKKEQGAPWPQTTGR